MGCTSNLLLSKRTFVITELPPDNFFKCTFSARGDHTRNTRHTSSAHATSSFCMCSGPRYTQLAPRQLYPCLRIQRTLVMHPGAPSINWLARSCAFPITVVDVFAAAFVVFSCIQWLIGCKFKLCVATILYGRVYGRRKCTNLCAMRRHQTLSRGLRGLHGYP